MGWLDGEVALVTGGGSGIGRAVVARFVEEGARVAVMDRVAGRGEALEAEFGDKVAAIAGDVARLDDNKRAVAETVAAFGRLDIFVGNAGVLDGFVRLADMAEDSLAAACDELFAVNVKGCILGAKAVLPELTKTQGCMIFTASGAGFTSAGAERSHHQSPLPPKTRPKIAPNPSIISPPQIRIAQNRTKSAPLFSPKIGHRVTCLHFRPFPRSGSGAGSFYP